MAELKSSEGNGRLNSLQQMMHTTKQSMSMVKLEVVDLKEKDSINYIKKILMKTKFYKR